MKKTLQKLTKVCDGCAPLAECPILDSLDREDSVNSRFETKLAGTTERGGFSMLPSWLARRAGPPMQDCFLRWVSAFSYQRPTSCL